MQKFEKLELLQAIRQNYFIAFENYNKSSKIEVINANQDIHACAEEVWNLVEPLLKTSSSLT